MKANVVIEGFPHRLTLVFLQAEDAQDARSMEQLEVQMQAGTFVHLVTGFSARARHALLEVVESEPGDRAISEHAAKLLTFCPGKAGR